MKATGYGIVCGCSAMAAVYASAHERHGLTQMCILFALMAWIGLFFTKGNP